MSDRFFCQNAPRDGMIRLEGDEARHLARAARRQIGDVIEVFLASGEGFDGEIVEIGRDSVTVAVRNALSDRVASAELTLLVAPPKGDRFDWIVEKATEIGVTRLVPILCERSVVDPRISKIERLRKVVVESSKQCGRNRLMILDEPMPLTRILGRDSGDVRMFADAGGLSASRWPAISPTAKVEFAVGPEGGWTDNERRLAVDSGWITVGLGPTRLRVETAAIVGPAVVFSRISSEVAS